MCLYVFYGENIYGVYDLLRAYFASLCICDGGKIAFCVLITNSEIKQWSHIKIAHTHSERERQSNVKLETEERITCELQQRNGQNVWMLPAITIAVHLVAFNCVSVIVAATRSAGRCCFCYYNKTERDSKKRHDRATSNKYLSSIHMIARPFSNDAYLRKNKHIPFEQQ